MEVTVRSPRAAFALLSLTVVLVACQGETSPPPPPPPPDWLWVSVWSQNKLLAFDDEQLLSGATGAQAALAIGLGSGRSPYGFDFDADGDLWVGTQEGELLEYASADIATSGTPEPVSDLPTGVAHVAGVRIAPDGTLWATMQGKLSAWRATTLAAGGSPAPDVTLTSASPFMTLYPNDLAFDEDGGLWVVGTGAVLRFAPAQLETGGEVEPDVVISSDGDSLAGPRGLAFDASGDLWVSNLTGQVVEKFRRQDLLASGSPAPIVSLQVPGTDKVRVAFDSEDRMYVSHLYGPSFGPSGYVAVVSPPNRVTSGAAPVSAEFTELGSMDVGGAMAFRPGPE